MRQPRFIVVALISSLLAPNAALLRKTITVLLSGVLSVNSVSSYSFLNQGEVASAATPPAEPINLTGTWIVQSPLFVVDQRGCTLKRGNVEAGQITMTQRGNQLIFDDSRYRYAKHSGSVSANKFIFTNSVNAPSGTYTDKLIGIISNDGNTITGEVTCKASTGPATAKATAIWTRKVSQFALTRATTTDAENVTVDYTIGANNGSESSQPIHFEIYRSSTEDADHAQEKIGEQDIEIGENDIPNSTNSSPDKHRVKLNLPVDSLKPNTAAPYVVVVATYNGKKSTTYFRKWLLGAISHGFNRYNQAGVIGFGFRAYYHHESGLDDDPGRIPDWETNMAQNLKEYDKYDDVISFDWTKTCALEQPDMAVQAGANLSKQITQWISTHRQHDGDVVDIHLIGHSRGTVVVTQALQYLSTASPSFEGGYIEITLLDPHPASNKFGQWADFGTDGKGKETDIAIAAELYTDHFQEIANDPPLMLPKGIKKIDIWYQQTRANDLVGDPDGAYIMNLWGFYKVGEGNAIRNNSGLLIEPTKIPNTTHNQVPNVYERQVVETGMLNRSN